MAQDWATQALTDDLMKKLRLDRMIAVREVTLRDTTGQRADVVAMHRTLNNRPLLIFEIKTARSDLLGDLRREKWRGYLADGAVAFAFPEGLAQAKEIPPEAGVIMRSGHGWRWRRSPPWAKAPCPTPYLYRRLVLTVADQTAERTAALYRPKARGLFDAARKEGQETGRRLRDIAQNVDVWAKLVEEKKAEYDHYVEMTNRQMTAYHEIMRSRRGIAAEAAA